MGLRGHDEYDESEIVSWDDYVIDRRETANFLLETFKDSDGPLSIRINASYGSGKTVFMRCLKQQASEDGFIVIYYNAWEEEISLDARGSLCMAILKEIEKNAPEKKIEAKIASFQKAILPIIAKAGISALSRFLLGDHKALLEAFDAADIGNTIANALKGGFEEAEKSRQQIFEIKNALLELIVALDGKKILILIDELDRCRPDFAIEVLETIKHFFSIKGIFAITGVYDEVLNSMIENRYGAIIVPEKYLQRHFNHKIDFGRFSYENYLLNQFKKSEAFKQSWIVQDIEFDNGIKSAAKYCAYICECGDFNLRQINTLINKIDFIVSGYCEARKKENKKLLI